MGPSQSTLANRRINVEIDLFRNQVAIDNLLPIYRHHFHPHNKPSNNRAESTADVGPKFRVVLTAQDDAPEVDMVAENVVSYCESLNAKLRVAASKLAQMTETLKKLARSSTRQLTPDDLDLIAARYQQRHPAPRVSATNGVASRKRSCSCSCGFRHPSKDEVEAKSKVLEDRVARLEAELKAIRKEQDMPTPCVVPDVTES